MVRATLTITVKPGKEDEFVEAWRAIAEEVSREPANLRQALMRDADAERTFVLLSEWESREAFLAWERDEIHMQTTTPMRPYWVGRVRRHIYDVAHRLGD